MYLKKLEMFGFKSFADRTDFQFQPGLTCIVGPNGCGKSNVVDAFKWIFGAQSAKGLRGSEMKDVIFNGTQTRKPAGYAEVSVVFDNHDGFLDIDYSEVEITRRLFRSGESEYLINKQKCRLKDIRELFLDTGVGQSSYSILEQGKIDVLLQSSPQDRRMIFEEAAGISKYRVKKAETLRALLRVEDNLSRLQDILDEVEKQIRRVKAQASKARRYKEHSDRLKELRIRLALEDYRSLSESKSTVESELRWSSYRLSLLESYENRLRDELEDGIRGRQGLSDSLRETRERLAGETSARERTQERIEQAERRLLELAEETERKKIDHEDTVETLGRLRREIEEGRTRERALHETIEERRESVGDLVATWEDGQAALRNADEDLRTRKSQAVAGLERKSRVGNRLVQVASELANLANRGERLEAAIRGFRAQLDESSERRDTVAARVAEIEERLAALQEEKTRLDSSSDELEGDIEAQADLLAERREDLHRKSSRFDVLKSFEERLDGVASGVAEVLKRSEELTRGARPLGMVGTLIRVPRRHASAVEAALGELSQALVVESHEGAVALLRFAQDESLGAVRVVALERVDYVEPESFPRQGGVLGPLRDVVGSDDLLEELIDRLLANVVLVEDLRTAVALSRNGLRPFRLVTTHGEIIEPWGALAVAGESDTGIISRRSEMDELLVEVRALEEECAQIESSLGTRRMRLVELRERRSELAQSIDEEGRGLVAARGELSQVEKEAERLSREVGVSTSELAEVSTDIEVRERDRGELEKESRAIEEEQEHIEEAIVAIEASLVDRRRSTEVAAEAVSQARLELAQAEKTHEGLAELVSEREQNLATRERHAGDVTRDLENLATRERETREQLERSNVEVQEVRSRESVLGEELAVLEREESRHTEVERVFRASMEKLRTAAGGVRREREDLTLRDQEERHRRNAIIERVDEQYGMDLLELVAKAEARLDAERAAAAEAERAAAAEAERAAAAKDGAQALEAGGEETAESESFELARTEDGAASASPDADGASAEREADEEHSQRLGATEESSNVAGTDSCDAVASSEVETGEAVQPVPEGDERYLVPLEDWDRDAAQREIKDLQEKLRRLGSVNLEALEEIDELEARYTFQKSQKEDLDASQRNLRAIIQDINRKSREMFSETFKKVQEHFSELFRKSFGGGRAELVLEDAADVLEAGIEIVARPPGKKLTSLSLMSGGEKTMTTIALLLAIFRSRPSPFCVLDEVDAPLDDANVRRFIILVKDFVDQSQFLIISHNKLTMAEASTLYGVTMQERGVSKRVAVELESYDPEEMELAASSGSS